MHLWKSINPCEVTLAQSERISPAINGFPSQMAGYAKIWYILGCSSEWSVEQTVVSDLRKKRWSGPVFYLHSSLLKLSKLWDRNFSFNFLKQIHFFISKFWELTYARNLDFSSQHPTWLGTVSDGCNEYCNAQNSKNWLTYENKSRPLSFPSFLHPVVFVLGPLWCHTTSAHSRDVISPLLCHTKITQCVLKQNKENTNV